MKRVLIFDSGVGGLSIYQEIYSQLPQVQYVYAFDDAAFPYGELSEQELISRTVHIVTLLTERHQIDLVVIACNTASTIVLPTLRHSLSIPVVGVVPAIKPAALNSQRKVIGLLATPATVKRQYIDTLISQFASDCEVLRIGSTRLVEIAEEKLRGLPVSTLELKDILSPWKDQVDNIILGCTHFPLIKKEILVALGGGVDVVDSGKAVANRVKALLGNIEDCHVPIVNLTYNSAAVECSAALNVSFAKLKLNTIQSLHFPRS
ncbi:glutamate racemase [Photobacterium minamisatsumaniensis]|uniref:glutamate racemase n=1 Tax=Photobacterium minamisatsumaniensis TaxID=2910233 RepID=UPI003D097B93